MRKYGLCLDYERNLWKSFYNTLPQAKGNAGKLEGIYRIDLMPAEAIAPKLTPHMIVSRNKNVRNLEGIFLSYDSARKAYNKKNLNVTIADIMPVWKIFKISKRNNRKEKVFEARI